MREATSPPNPPQSGASCKTSARLVFRTDASVVSTSQGASVRRSTTSSSYPSAAHASAASKAHDTPPPQLITVAAAPSLAMRAFPNGISYGVSGTGPLSERYKRLCSKKSTGFGSRIARASNPLASQGVAGNATFRPGMWQNQASLDCEWNGPAPIPPPMGARIVTGRA